MYLYKLFICKKYNIIYSIDIIEMIQEEDKKLFISYLKEEYDNKKLNKENAIMLLMKEYNLM